MTVTTKTRKTLTKKVATKVRKVNSRVKTLAAGLVGKTRKNNCKCNCKNNNETCKNICIDYPQNNETVYCGHYCFRLGSRKPCSAMQVSINGGEWQNCRQANGYWWYDWWNFNTGNFYLEAKAYVDGKEEQTAKRKFKVTL